MEEVIKSEGSTKPKYQSETQSKDSQIHSIINKTQDDINPQKIILSLIMKFLPITIYLALKLATNQQLSLFILISLILAIDFWTTKNILGPKMVGLKWFSVYDENQKQKFCFASCQDTRLVSKVNSLFFWMPQIIAILFWIVIIFFNIITLGLFWVALAIYSAFLLILNFGLFLQCRGDHQSKVNYFSKKFGFQVYKKDDHLEFESSAV